MKKIKYYFILLLVISLSFLCVGCSANLDSYSTQINKSMSNVKSIDTKEEIKDGDVVVYSLVKKITFTSDTSADVVTTTSTLSSGFVLTDTTKNDTLEKINKSDLNKLKLDNKFINSYTYKNNVLNMEVSKENIATVLGSTDLKILDKANITITFENKKIVNMVCTFKTETSKDVTISTNYTY